MLLLTVPDIVHSKTIAELIAQLKPHDTLIVPPGTYSENKIKISFPVTIIGNDYPVLDCENNGSGFLVESDSVTISGFVIRNTGLSYSEEICAIKVSNSKYVSITDNIILDTQFGIYFANTANSEIKRNKLISKPVSESSSGNGIHFWKCDSIVTSYNFIQGYRDGIYLEFVTNSSNEFNRSMHNLRYGLHFMFSNNNSYIRNILTKNGAGVAVMYTNKVLVKDNYFGDNWGPASYGLLLKDINESTVTGNIFNRNTSGIYMESSNRNLITKNELLHNGWAIKILGSCYDNEITQNNFISNTFDVSTNSRKLVNNIDGNYWSSYDGFDLNGDGIGDIPHHPVKLFSYLVERSPEASFLMKSFIVNLLDFAETKFPSVSPVDFIDNYPFMEVIIK
ncbi:MAG: nitrous oxide reductase family maturation protein NosD [Ignavibacteria bacterium]|mgnify:CR=1 FL=1|nr:putative ABC transporter binding protein NosD [Ignavibacteria bacterium]MCC6885519.1 nitrous oxide reductase family maturation protein NosD [Ignavibacteriales bacterium]